MTQTTAFKTPEGEAAYLSAYEAAMNLWPVPYEEIEIPTRFGMTHVVTCGPQDAPPMVLLHGYFGTLTMWSPNIADFSKDHRVYVIDVMGQSSKSVPDLGEPIRDAGDFSTWLSETLNGLNLERIYLVGLSFGGWLALNFTISASERVQKLALLSPAASLQPSARQFSLRGMLMGAALYAEAYPKVKHTILTWGDFGKITLPQILGINHWIIIGIFVIGGVVLLRWFEKKGL